MTLRPVLPNEKAVTDEKSKNMRSCHVASPVYGRNSNTEMVMDATRIESSIPRLVDRGTVHLANVSSAIVHIATALPASVASREGTLE